MAPKTPTSIKIDRQMCGKAQFTVKLIPASGIQSGESVCIGACGELLPLDQFPHLPPQGFPESKFESPSVAVVGTAGNRARAATELCLLGSRSQGTSPVLGIHGLRRYVVYRVPVIPIAIENVLIDRIALLGVDLTVVLFG